MRLLLILLAMGLVVYGVVESSLPWVLGATAALTFLWWRVQGAALDAEIRRYGRLAQAALGPRWQQLTLLALFGSGIAGWTAYQSNPTLIGVDVWLGSLALLVAAGIVHDRGRKHAAADAANDTARKRWDRFDWIAVIGLTALALGLRVYHIGTYLPPVHGDEGEMGMLALLALHGPTPGLGSRPLLPFDTAFLGHPTLFHYLQAVGMRVFGESITGLRLTSALFGALCAPVIYATGRAAWGRVAGLTAGWLLAVSHLHIHFSRIALNNIETVLCMVLLVWLLARLDQARDDSAQGDPAQNNQAQDGTVAAGGEPVTAPLLLPVLIGLVIGVAQYFYYGSRLLPVVAAPLIFVLWRRRKITAQQAAFVVMGAAAAYLPLAVHYATHWRAFSDRVNGVSVFSPLGMAHTLGPDAVWPADIPRLLWTQLRLNLSLFLNYGDHSSFYSADIPAFDKVTVALFWLGLGLVLARATRFAEMMLLVWFVLGVLLGGVATTDAPNAPRLIVAVPAIFLMGGVFVQGVADALAALSAHAGEWRGRIAPVTPALALAAATIYLNFNTYFVDYQQMQPSPAQLEIAQEMAAGAQDYTFYLMGAPNLYAEYGTIRFIARAAHKDNLDAPDDLPQKLAQQRPDQAALIIALPHRITDLEEIEAQFPGGTETERKDKHDQLLYVTYSITAAEVRQAAAH